MFEHMRMNMRIVVLVACVWVIDFVDNRNGLAILQQLEVN